MPERLVHGPLTAMMLLETLLFNKPDVVLGNFEYQARNPVLVNRTCTIHGAFLEAHTAILWCEDDDGVVGMTGKVRLK